jgi:hypothetical protein
MDDARAEAVQEVSSEILKAAGAAMGRHGDDPNGGAIVAAGFAMALKAIGKHIDCKIPAVVREMLKEPA